VPCYPRTAPGFTALAGRHRVRGLAGRNRAHEAGTRTSDWQRPCNPRWSRFEGGETPDKGDRQGSAADSLENPEISLSRNLSLNSLSLPQLSQLSLSQLLDSLNSLSRNGLSLSHTGTPRPI